MRRFEIAGSTLREDDPALPAAIARAYRDRIRPICLCREPGIPMYVAAMGEQHVVKRMPLSGMRFTTSCSPIAATYIGIPGSRHRHSGRIRSR